MCTPSPYSRKDSRPSSRQRGYTAAWDKARASFLQRYPYCVMCQREGRKTLATVVDHVERHRGDAVRFWDKSRWQSLCVSHHSGAKQQIEKHGYHCGVGNDGLPLDPNHPFLRGHP